MNVGAADGLGARLAAGEGRCRAEARRYKNYGASQKSRLEAGATKGNGKGKMPR